MQYKCVKKGVGMVGYSQVKFCQFAFMVLFVAETLK